MILAFDTRSEPPDAPATPYDAVPYISWARNASSVDRLAMLGRLLGMAAADPCRCRALELGCGDGGNLIPMAVSYPGSQFVGIDLAPTAIERARQATAELRLPNITFLQGAFGQAPADDRFDYVVAHGVYSWVPQAAREELLATIRSRLAPQGLAFVSYNARPGGQFRAVLRDMMLMHTSKITDPAQKVAQARALLGMLATAPDEGGRMYRPLLNSELGKALATSDFLLYHDDLAEVSEPFFFSDFMDAASRHGLQFASEANFHQMSLFNMPPEVAGVLANLGETDMLAKEQYLDFMVCRGFRQTVLCHDEIALDRGIDVDRIRQFLFRSRASRAEQDAPGKDADFRGPDGSALRTDNPIAIAAMAVLSQSFPRPVTFAQLSSAAGCANAAEEETLAEVLFAALSAGVVEFHAGEPAVVFDVGDRPVASPWARYRIAAGRAANLFHETVSVDESGRAVLALLDGEHTVADVAGELGVTEAQARAEVDDLAKRALFVG